MCLLAGSWMLSCGTLPAEEAEILPTVELGETLFVAPELAEGAEAAVEVTEEPRAIVDGIERSAPQRRIAPHVDFKTTYDDNIFIQRKNKVSDVIFTLAPGIAFGWWDDEARLANFLDRKKPASSLEHGRGNFLAFDYTAIFLGFTDNSAENSFDQDAHADAQWQSGKLTLSGRLRFESNSEPNIEIGGRVRTRTLTAEATARYEVGGKITVEANVSVEKNEREDFVSAVVWQTEDYVEYKVRPGLRLGLGAAVGEAQVEAGPDQVFERILARGVVTLSEKLSVSGRAGVEFRQSDGRLGDRTDPVFNLSLEYEPWAETRLTIEGYRRVQVSALSPDELITQTGFILKGERTIRAGTILSVEGGFELAEYDSATARTDHFFFVRPSLVYNFATWGNVQLAYRFRSNDSTRGESGFTNNEVSVQVSLTY